MKNKNLAIIILFSKTLLTLSKLIKNPRQIVPLSLAYLALSIHGFEKSMAKRIIKIFKENRLISVSTRGIKINLEKFERIIQTKNKELEKELGRRKVEKLISYIKKAKIAYLP